MKIKKPQNHICLNFSKQYLKCSTELLSHSKLCISRELWVHKECRISIIGWAKDSLDALRSTEWSWHSFSIYLIFCHIPLQEAVSHVARGEGSARSLAHSHLSYQHVLKGLFLDNQHQLNLLHFWLCPRVSFLQSHSQQLLDFVPVTYFMVLIPLQDYSLYDKRS